jgi:hypothetical protein
LEKRDVACGADRARTGPDPAGRWSRMSHLEAAALTHDLHHVRSRLRELPLEPQDGGSKLRRLLDQHRNLVEWLTTPVGKRLYKP